MKTAMKQAEERDRRQPEVLDDLHVLAGRELADQVGRGDQQHREADEVVEHLVAHRLLEDVPARSERDGSAPAAAPVCRRAAGALRHADCDEEVLERLAQRVERHEPAPPSAQLADERARAASRPAARSRTARARSRVTLSRTAARSRRRSVVAEARDDHAPSPRARRPGSRTARPAATSRPAARMRDAAAERLGVASRMCELKKTVQPAVAQAEDQRRGRRGGRADRAPTSARRGRRPRDR